MRFTVFAAAIVFAAAAAPVYADDVQVVSQRDAITQEIRVKTSDQDVTTRAGAAAIDSRLQRAARVACAPELVDRPSATAERQIRACRAEALADARRDVGAARKTVASVR
jgi:UrcA family protein